MSSPILSGCVPGIGLPLGSEYNAATYTSSDLSRDKDRALQYPDVMAYLQKPIDKIKVKRLLKDMG